jgi:hypothetical protein
MTEPEPVLCFVGGEWAYFTTQPVTEQWGDDWDDVPYEHNAGEPYEYTFRDGDRGKAPWSITRVAFLADLRTPAWGRLNSPWSVREINAGRVPWLVSPSYESRKRVNLWAGTPLSTFVRAVLEYGGEVYTSVRDRDSAP